MSPDLPSLSKHVQEVARILNAQFLDKQELVRLLLVCVLAGEHAIVVGPPGTAKSAIVRMMARLIDARYFEYLLTRFSEPNEIFGPLDMKEFREGRYLRRVENMLPTAEIVFLDEIFKSNSAILNSLLGIVNERRFTSGPEVKQVPLLSMFGASNEVPSDEGLAALFDRFLVRIFSDNLDSYHFQELMARGVAGEIRQLTGQDKNIAPVISAQEVRLLHSHFDPLASVPEEFLLKYKHLIFQIRSEGISISDRRAVKLVKLFAASAVFDGRSQVCDGDFYVLRHVWNTVEQVEILADIVNPVVDAYYRAHPTEKRSIGRYASLDAVLSELTMIRNLLINVGELSDIQLFSLLRNLNDIKIALAGIQSETARRMERDVEQMLASIFSSSKFGA